MQLHAFVEYESIELAEKAVSKLKLVQYDTRIISLLHPLTFRNLIL